MNLASDTRDLASENGSPTSEIADISTLDEQSYETPSTSPGSSEELATIQRETEDSKDTTYQLSHLTASGEAHMVNITKKQVTSRSATAVATLLFSTYRTYKSLISATLQKGDALAVARIAGIQAAKRTADLIPLAHPGLGLTGVVVKIKPFSGRHESDKILNKSSHDPDRAPIERSTGFGGVSITATVDCCDKTGVEMEALSAATVSALTMYDMLKGIDKGMVITSARVTAKKGGKSGDWVWRSTSVTDAGSLNGMPINLAVSGDESHTPPTQTSHAQPRKNKQFFSQAAEKIEIGREKLRQEMEKIQLAREKFRLDHEKFLWREERLRVEKERLCVDREKLHHEKQKMVLSSTDIKKEIQEGITNLQRQQNSGSNDNSSSSTKKRETDINNTTVNSNDSSSSSSSPSHRSSPSSSSSSVSSVLSPSNSNPDWSNHFNGQVSMRPDTVDFAQKRMERYEEWANAH